MDEACLKCHESGCCFNCINYNSSFQLETMIHIDCKEYTKVATQERGYPIIDGVITTDCKKWERRII